MVISATPRAAAAAEEAVNIARQVTGKGAKASEGAAARGLSLLGKEFQAEIKSLEDMLKHSSAINDPAGAAQIWDKIFKEIAKNAKFQGKPIGPGSDVITYKTADGKLISQSIKDPPPVGAERISLTDADLRAMMPPRPAVPAEAAPKPVHSYDAPRPAGMEPPVSAAPVQEAVDTAKAVTGGAPPRATPWGSAPTQPSASVPSVKPSASPEPDTLLKYGVYAPATAAGAGAVGTGVMYGYDPELTQKAIQAAKSVYGIEPDYNPSQSVGDDMANPPVMAYQGPGVSYDPSDFVSDNLPGRHRESAVSYDQSDFFPYPETQYNRQGPLADRLPGGGSTVQRALTASRGSPRAEVSSTQMPAAQSADTSSLASFLRGRFGEAGRGSAMEDRLTAAQEARDRMGEGMASGGQVNKPHKDAALHKALEIIHHMISRK
jgi:hypothetical protein